MENNHLKAAEELENLFDRKVAFEHEKYVSKEQEMKEDKMRFETKVSDIEKRYEENLLLLNKEFKDNFGRAQKVNYFANSSTLHYI